jgi:hypothetical protein
MGDSMEAPGSGPGADHARLEYMSFCRSVVIPLLRDDPGFRSGDEVLKPAFELYRLDEILPQISDRILAEMADHVREVLSGEVVPEETRQAIGQICSRIRHAEHLDDDDRGILLEWVDRLAVDRTPDEPESLPRAELRSLIDLISGELLLQKARREDGAAPGVRSAETEHETAVVGNGGELGTETVSTAGVTVSAPPAPVQPEAVPTPGPSDGVAGEGPNPVLRVEFDHDDLIGIKDRVAALQMEHIETWGKAVLQTATEVFAETGSLPFAFEEFRGAAAEDLVVVVPEVSDDTAVWFIGDVHGDMLALEAALRHIEAKSAETNDRVVFLGDLFDDGHNGGSVFLRVVEEVLCRPGSVLMLTGNHDEGLAFDQEAGHFVSTVSPAEFADDLNSNNTGGFSDDLGRFAIDVFKTTPRAIFLPDGIFAAHGGIPHTDRHASILSREDLNHPVCLQDFVWTRAHPRAKRKIPNRCSRGCQFGFEDFGRFCEVASKALDMPVEKMVRGHDHVDERFLLYPKYEYKLLTINALSRRLSREWGGEYERTPCVARWEPGRQIEVHRLMIPSELVREIYPEPHGEEGGE